MNILDVIQHQVMSNPIFTGLAGGAAVTGALAFVGYQLRAFPTRMISLIKNQFTVTLSIFNEDEVYHSMSLWLAAHPKTEKIRRFNVVTKWDHKSERRVHKLTPGSGTHFIRHNNRWFIFRKDIIRPTAGGGAMTKTETITITTFGRDPKPIQNLISDITETDKVKDTIPLYFWTSRGFKMCGERLKRPLETVFLSEDQKERILADLQRFLASHKWYSDRGIPWRRTFLLEGPPGTGKSTLIFALASALNKPVYIINPSTIHNDSILLEAMNSAGNGIVVIEDADSFKVTHERKKNTKSKKAEQVAEGGAIATDSIEEVKDTGNDQAGITQSGFLNAVDGIASGEGRILFITSNHPDMLDAAIMRPGRVDRREHLGLANIEVAKQMYKAYFPQGNFKSFAKEIEPKLPIAPAAIQGMLLQKMHIVGPEL